jgi:hypothetical protein
MEQTFFLGTTSKSHYILNYKIQKQIKFESCLNFKGVQTFCEKYHQITKVLYSYDFQEYEFRLAHLHSRIWGSFTSGKYELLS